MRVGQLCNVKRAIFEAARGVVTVYASTNENVVDATEQLSETSLVVFLDYTQVNLYVGYCKVLTETGNVGYVRYSIKDGIPLVEVAS